MADRYQGDPKLTLDENGANLTFKGGQPEMDRGLENAALISLHTREGWAGNVYQRSPANRIGSKYEKTLEKPITLQVFNDVRNAAKSALQWMIDNRVASTVEAEVNNPTGKQVATMVLIQPPSDDPLVLLQTKNCLNWISQKLDPAHLRI